MVGVKRKVVWLSAGVSSFIAGYLVKDTVDDWIYIDIADQHPDSMRFIKDCEKALGVEVQILRSKKFGCVEDVLRHQRCINTATGAPCTGMLKKAVRKVWEKDHLEDELTYVWGFDLKEKTRAHNIKHNFPEFNHEFPLIDRGFSKQDAHGLIAKLGIKRPAMYDMGYMNNNCVGCVRGGMWYWNKIRKDFPEVFESRAKLEREVGHSCIKGVFLDELDPKAGRKSEELTTDCGVICYLESMKIEGINGKDE